MIGLVSCLSNKIEACDHHNTSLVCYIRMRLKPTRYGIKSKAVISVIFLTRITAFIFLFAKLGDTLHHPLQMYIL